MANSFYSQSEQFRNEVKALINSFNLSDLYKKENYQGSFQEVILTGELVTVTITQKRIYENTMPYKTNTVGDINVFMTDGTNECTYEYNYLLFLLSWHNIERPYRLIVPSNLLSNEIMKQFIVKIIEGGLPSYSTETEQFVYYIDIDGGEILLQMFPTIINERRGE